MILIRNTFYLLLAILALPLLFIFNFRMMIKFLGGLFGCFTDVSLSEKDYRKRIQFKTIKASPSMEKKQAVAEQCYHLIDNQDWTALSDQLTDWDQTRATCAAGFPLAQVGMAASLGHLAEGAFEGHHCHPDPILYFEDNIVARLETQSAIHTDSYPLLAMAAEMRCYQGWTHRGADYAQYVSDDGWFGMGERFAKAAWLLEKFDPTDMNAPILAAVRHKLLGFMPDADKHVQDFYELWSRLDPKDQQPHRKHATMMLPRWFGSEQMLEIEARKAVARTTNVTGDAAYFSMYREVFNHWETDILTVDIDMLKSGAHDLITLRGEDPAFVAQLLEELSWVTAYGSDTQYNATGRAKFAELSTELEALRRDLILTRLTAICPSAWEFGVTGALDEISVYLQSEIKADAKFLMDEGGLRVLAAENEPVTA